MYLSRSVTRMLSSSDPPQGFIFDLDGTLVDNMAIHREAFQRFSERRPLPRLSNTMWEQLDGKRNRDIFPILFERDLSDEELREFAREKESLYRTLSAQRLEPLAGVERLLEILAARRIPFAIATSAPLENVDHTLSALGLESRFPVIVRSDEVEHGKPHPDVYLAVARRLDLAPETCVGFEDAPAGIAAVLAARMTCVGITTTMTADRLRSHGTEPHHVVKDYEEFLDGPGRWLAE